MSLTLWTSPRTSPLSTSRKAEGWVLAHTQCKMHRVHLQILLMSIAGIAVSCITDLEPDVSLLAQPPFRVVPSILNVVCGRAGVW